MNISPWRCPEGLLRRCKANFHHQIPWSLTSTYYNINSEIKKKGRHRKKKDLSEKAPYIWRFLSQRMARRRSLNGCCEGLVTASALTRGWTPIYFQNPVSSGTAARGCWLLTFKGWSSPLRALPPYNILYIYRMLTTLFWPLLKSSAARLDFLQQSFFFFFSIFRFLPLGMWGWAVYTCTATLQLYRI